MATVVVLMHSRIATSSKKCDSSLDAKDQMCADCFLPLGLTQALGQAVAPGSR